MTRRRAPRQAEAERNDRALLRAAREVLAVDGAHTSVAAIAARAGVGIGSLYRRYRTKQELFQHLAVLSLEHGNAAAERGLADPDPWNGLARYVTDRIEFGQGWLGPVAGSIRVSDEMQAQYDRSEKLFGDLVARAHRAGVLRPDVTTVDISLLIEQLGRSPVLDQLRLRGRDDLVPAAESARRRLVAIALDGLRSAHTGPLPGEPPSERLFTERWSSGASG